MNKITTIFIIILISISSTACSNTCANANKQIVKYNYIYIGQNDTWDAEYNVNGKEIFGEENGCLTYDSECTNLLTVTYKNELSELSTIKKLDISYKSSVKGGSINMAFPDDGEVEQTYTLKSGSSGGAKELEDETILVTITIDGKSQEIELKNQDT